MEEDLRNPPAGNNVLLVSGGKDSLAMLDLVLNRGENIASVVFYDGGWEWRETLAAIDHAEQLTGLKVHRLRGDYCGEFSRRGWPRPRFRWCTDLKARAINAVAKTISKAVVCIGFAADETDRARNVDLWRRDPLPKRFPLIEAAITQAEALRRCLALGYTWGNLYNWNSRISCFCCPIMRRTTLPKIREHRPEAFRRIVEMDRHAQRLGFRSSFSKTIEKVCKL